MTLLRAVESFPSVQLQNEVAVLFEKILMAEEENVEQPDDVQPDDPERMADVARGHYPIRLVDHLHRSWEK